LMLSCRAAATVNFETVVHLLSESFKGERRTIGPPA
jgi:hypothetical protein